MIDDDKDKKNKDKKPSSNRSADPKYSSPQKNKFTTPDSSSDPQSKNRFNYSKNTSQENNEIDNSREEMNKRFDYAQEVVNITHFEEEEEEGNTDEEISINSVAHNDGAVTSPAINDSASKEDHIGFTPYVQSLARMIRHKETLTPLVIGVYGPWGTGKTSFMIQLENEIRQLSAQDRYYYKNKFYHVKFDAWKHQSNDKVWAALLQAIPVQLEKNLNLVEILERRFKHAWNKLNLTSKISYGFIFWSTVTIATLNVTYYLKSGEWLTFGSLFDAVPALGILFTWNNIIPSFGRMLSPLGMDLKNIVDNKSLVGRVDSVQNFTEDLKHIIKTNVGDEGRLIIYIDDLDRCSPSNVTEVVEALNVFLDSKQCIFILGMDREKVAKSIGVKYAELCDNKYLEYGNDFLEKIVQLPINLPFMGDKDAMHFSNQLLSVEENSNASIKNREKNNTVYPVKNEFVDIAMPEVLKSDLKESLMYLKQRSPRNIKRFLNKAWFYYLLSQVDAETFMDVDPKYLGLWLLIYELYPKHVKSMKGASLVWDELIGDVTITSHDSGDIRDLVQKIRNNPTYRHNPWLSKYRNPLRIDPYIKLTDSVDVDNNITAIAENNNGK